MSSAKVEQHVIVVAGTSQSALVGRGSLAKSSTMEEQHEAPHEDNTALTTSREEPSPMAGITSLTKERVVRGAEIEIPESFSNVGDPIASPSTLSTNNLLPERTSPRTISIPVVRVFNILISVLCWLVLPQ